MSAAAAVAAPAATMPDPCKGKALGDFATAVAGYLFWKRLHVLSTEEENIKCSLKLTVIERSRSVATTIFCRKKRGKCKSFDIFWQ